MRARSILPVVCTLVLASASAAAGKPFAPKLSPDQVLTTPCVPGTDTLCVPLDATFTVVPFGGCAGCSGPADPADPCRRNDDDFSGPPIALPFTFQLYGTNYNVVFINNNGNLSFGNGYPQFSSTGFPVAGFPMVAPFWADVDTRGALSGVVRYRLDANKLVVIWDHVGYYGAHDDLLNTFEVMISDGTDPAVGLGNNVCFCYDNMQWTTGDASQGQHGFGGTPATVGINKGDGVHFFQVGRFGVPGGAYDGPGGATDGVDYLSHRSFCFDASNGSDNQPPVPTGFPADRTIRLCDDEPLSLATAFTSPEIGQTTTTVVDPGSLPPSRSSVTSTPGDPSNQVLTFTPNATDVGHSYVVTYTATDDGTPPATTVVALTIVVTDCSKTHVRGLDWFQDAFPFNPDPGKPGTADFDTLSALIKTGRNAAQLTGTACRPDIPADSLVACACGTGIRVDLVFRILPGPGNYQVASGPRRLPPTSTMRLLQLPSSQAQVAVAGDPSFWGQYIANPGEFGTPLGHHGNTYWDPNTWNSARMDTAGVNLFPVQSNASVPRLDPCMWSATYHESDPKYTVLGILKSRCFLLDPTQDAVDPNITCDSLVAAASCTWLAGSPSTGWNGVYGTREYTKIIPDGLLTAGSHVEYFIRRSPTATPASFTMTPDTTVVTPQAGEIADTEPDCTHPGGSGSTDAHRWEQFSILPDRWKDVAYGGQGNACMLYIDLDVGYGDEAKWVVAADMIDATTSSRYGSHNGWHVSNADADPNDPANFVRTHGGQAGTTWDMYGVRGVGDWEHGSAGAIGGRLGCAPSGSATGKQAIIGPTLKMLTTYYHLLYMTSGSLDTKLLGPLTDRSQDDVAMITGFLQASSGGYPRGLFVEGDGFAQSEHVNHAGFLSSMMGAQWVASNYYSAAPDLGACVDLQIGGPAFSPPGMFGVANSNTIGNDILDAVPGNGGVVVGNYLQSGTGTPFGASVYLPAAPSAQNWYSLLDGWGLQDQSGRYCPNNLGRVNYLYYTFKNVFGIPCMVPISPSGSTAVPPPATMPDVLELVRNPVKAGAAQVRFSLAHADRVELAVFDVSGRRLATLADGPFAAGMHTVTWDGASAGHGRVVGSVYFVHARYAGSGFQATRALVMLR